MGQAPQKKKSAEIISTLIGVLFLLFDQQMSMRKSVEVFCAVSFGNAFGIDSDKIVRLEAIDRFDLGKQPAVVFIEQAELTDKMSARSALIFSLYHLSEITILHEIAQKAGFSRLWGYFRRLFMKC